MILTPANRLADEELERACEKHIRATWGHYRDHHDWLFIGLLEAARQHRWADLRWYADKAKAGDHGSLVNLEMDCLLIRLSEK